MSINYVKFQRGSQNAYNRLLSLNRIDDNTLYFIYSDNGGKLYLGDCLIGGAGTGPTNLSDLTDVIIEKVQTDSFLIQNQEGKWVNISLNEVITLIKNDLFISVDNISNLNKWITDNRNNIEGLMSIEDKNNISTLLNNVEILSTQVSNITQDLTNYVLYSEYNDKISELNSNIASLQEALTWSSID